MNSQNFLVILLLSYLVSCYALWDLIPILTFLFPHSFLSAPSPWAPFVYHIYNHTRRVFFLAFFLPLVWNQIKQLAVGFPLPLPKNSIFPLHLFLCHMCTHMKTCYSSYDPEKQCMQNLPCLRHPSSRGSFFCTHSQLKCSATWLHTRFLLFCFT